MREIARPLRNGWPPGLLDRAKRSKNFGKSIGQICTNPHLTCWFSRNRMQTRYAIKINQPSGPSSCIDPGINTTLYPWLAPENSVAVRGRSGGSVCRQGAVPATSLPAHGSADEFLCRHNRHCGVDPLARNALDVRSCALGQGKGDLDRRLDIYIIARRERQGDPKTGQCRTMTCKFAHRNLACRITLGFASTEDRPAMPGPARERPDNAFILIEERFRRRRH